jgi:hypothetical protein
MAYPDICPRCCQCDSIDYVHGHYQCRECKCILDDCCQGEKAERNSYEERPE